MTIETVEDLIQYLQTLRPEMRVVSSSGMGMMVEPVQEMVVDDLWVDLHDDSFMIAGTPKKAFLNRMKYSGPVLVI